MRGLADFIIHVIRLQQFDPATWDAPRRQSYPIPLSLPKPKQRTPTFRGIDASAPHLRPIKQKLIPHW